MRVVEEDVLFGDVLGVICVEGGHNVEGLDAEERLT